MIRRTLWIVAMLLGVAFSVQLVAVLAWDSRTASLRQALDRHPAAPAVYSSADLEELPVPVERFFLHVLREGQPIIRAVDLTTEGEFQTGTTDDGWRRFTAWQRFSTNPAGFVWDARIQMAPFMPVYVRDSYVDGQGEMRGRILGVYPVVSEAHTPQLASGELHRYLAETIWFPTALLPGHNPITWQPIDTKSAVATFTDRGVSVSARFLFTPDGDVSEVFALDRMRAVSGGFAPTAWAVRCTQHEWRHGIRIPIACDAEWQRLDGPLPYWRGRVTNVVYTVSQ